MILLQDKLTRRITLDALFCAFAMMLSYLEGLIPIDLPIPGFRLGLANFVVMLVFCCISRKDAAVVSALRILLMGMLFGTATSLYFSFLGGLCSYLTLCILSLVGRRMSLIGVSILSAAMHNVGQTLAAVSLFGPSVILSYLPMLLVASVVYGGVMGILLNAALPRMQPILTRLGIGGRAV